MFICILREGGSKKLFIYFLSFLIFSTQRVSAQVFYGSVSFLSKLFSQCCLAMFL